MTVKIFINTNDLYKVESIIKGAKNDINWGIFANSVNSPIEVFMTVQEFLLFNNKNDSMTEHV